jgi:hypothetical protein
MRQMLCFYKTSWLCNSEDVRALFMYCVIRIGITYEAEAENITSVDIINKNHEVEVP